MDVASGPRERGTATIRSGRACCQRRVMLALVQYHLSASHVLLGIAVGLALSAAAGLRVFVPLLLTGLAARFGYLRLVAGMAWIESDSALVAFATATVVEIVAYYVPWLDNALDAIGTPAAVAAGVVTTAAVTPELPPLLRWTLAIVAGGGTAGFVQVSTTLLRLKSSLTTAGLGNPVLATAELIGAIAFSVLAVLAPLLAAVGVAIVIVVLIRRLVVSYRVRRKANTAAWRR